MNWVPNSMSDQQPSLRNGVPESDIGGILPAPSFAGGVLGSESLLSALGAHLSFHFSPIVNVATGACFGYQAIPSNVTDFGYASLASLLEGCFSQGILNAAQIQMWETALSAFTAAGRGRGKRLFLDLDLRSLEATGQFVRHIRGLMAHYDLPESSVAFEVSTPLNDPQSVSREWLRPFRACGCKLSLGGYGGDVGARLLHATEPDFIRIDSFFARDVWNDSRRKLLYSHMVSLAHLLGIVVVATGIETERDFLVCKEIGCDLAQGSFVASASRDLRSFPKIFTHVEQLARSDRRRREGDQKIILDQMERIPALPVDSSVTDVFDRLRNDTRQTFVPIVDVMGQPLGIVREANLKNYAYSPFGKDLISNKGLGRKLRDFIVRCPIAEVHLPVENIMAIYSGEDEAEGIMLVEQMRYVGFLSARSIIRVITEKNLAQARDQNPLTKLPGNALINQFVTESLMVDEETHVYAYVDFDNFKPFNDKYGFRLGDRAILLFAELMRKRIGQQHFLGHIGGDDFFIGFVGVDLGQAEQEVAELLAAFRRDAESFYDSQAREAGYITATDREGNLKQFPLLGASCALVEAPAGHPAASVDDISARIALMKKPAKNSPTKMASARLEPDLA